MNHKHYSPNLLANINWSTFKELVPRIDGAIQICSFEVDPEEIIRQLKSGTFCGRVKRIDPTLFAYRHDRQSGSVIVLRPDRLTIDILSRINAERSVAAVIASVRNSGLRDIPPIAFRDFFEQAADSGILKLYDKKG